ncbi:ImmA/IrrE family metallo-endopeptidase [Listeria sp. FSL L7-0253]|uniref:ImmA/IrrE family metallo-endopeptidase n=1 Tax=Listeria cossartiae TaxID=2838249 RepID=UPI0016257005|nr:ImmA/IrrE family metallo-endopeptidase [Listeria cossartiae]MBC2187260.1 ImmA/IrrE family metallo-endopeptidase [Listeria cossartiae subsp. cossartiae]
MAFKKKTKEEIKEEITQLTTDMHESIQSFSESPDKLKELLDFMSQFHKYSFRNQALIKTQFPGATCVGSFKAFSSLGFRIKKMDKSIGEKGIRIFKPREMLYYQKDKRWQLVSKATKEDAQAIKNGQLQTKKVVDFVMTTVFDISMTNASPEDVPELLPNKHENFANEGYLSEIYEALTSVGTKRDITIKLGAEFGLNIGLAKGMFINDKAGNKYIAMNPKNTESENVAVLIHELAHAELHGNDSSSGKFTSVDKEEYQAEMAAYVVSKHFGINTEESSMRYIASWTENGNTLEDTTELLTEVSNFSKKIIDETTQELENIMMYTNDKTLGVEKSM